MMYPKRVEAHDCLELQMDEFTVEQALQVLHFLKQEMQNNQRWRKPAYMKPWLRIRVPLSNEWPQGRVVFEPVLPDPVLLPNPIVPFAGLTREEVAAAQEMPYHADPDPLDLPPVTAQMTEQDRDKGQEDTDGKS